MPKISIAFVFLFLIFGSACETKETDKTSTQSEDEAELLMMSDELIALSTSVACTDHLLWAFAPIGSKPCGGPWSYIAYATTIDTVYFLNLLEEYRIAELNYNEKWGAISDCAIAQEPSAIQCQNGLAVFTY